ncbi:MAG: dockerin type I domain-containing protein [Dehalococcoidia bacterium]|nr:dockerin type I domain-containing protein [Dehalococcoidia bacterium]
MEPDFDLIEVAYRLADAVSETDPINDMYPGRDYDDRYDVNRDGRVNSLDYMAVGLQSIENPHRVCK